MGTLATCHLSEAWVQLGICHFTKNRKSMNTLLNTTFWSLQLDSNTRVPDGKAQQSQAGQDVHAAVSWVLIWAVGVCTGSLALQAEDLTASRTHIPHPSFLQRHQTTPCLNLSVQPSLEGLCSPPTREVRTWATRWPICLREESPADYWWKQIQGRQHHSPNCGNVFCQVIWLKIIEGACHNTVGRTLLPPPVAWHWLCQHIRLPQRSELILSGRQLRGTWCPLGFSWGILGLSLSTYLESAATEGNCILAEKVLGQMPVLQSCLEGHPWPWTLPPPLNSHFCVSKLC